MTAIDISGFFYSKIIEFLASMLAYYILINDTWVLNLYRLLSILYMCAEYDHGIVAVILGSKIPYSLCTESLVIPIYDDGIDEDVEGLILFLDVMESQLDPRDVGYINVSRSAYLITIYPSGMQKYTINIIVILKIRHL